MNMALKKFEIAAVKNNFSEGQVVECRLSSPANLPSNTIGKIEGQNLRYTEG
jgi:hypothetical protein